MATTEERNISLPDGAGAFTVEVFLEDGRGNAISGGRVTVEVEGDGILAQNQRLAEVETNNEGKARVVVSVDRRASRPRVGVLARTGIEGATVALYKLSDTSRIDLDSN